MKLGFRSIKNRIIVVFIAVTIFQIGAAAFFALFQLRPQITGIYEEHQEKMSEALLFEISRTKQDIESYSVNMIGDTMIQNFLEGNNAESRDPGIYGFPVELRNRILSYTNYDNRIKEIYLMDLNGSIYSNAVNLSAGAYIYGKEELLAQAESMKLWCRNGEEDDIALCWKVNNTTTDLNRRIGSLFIIMDKDIFLEVIGQFISQDEEKYTLKSTDGYMQIGDLDEESAAGENSGSYLIRSKTSGEISLTAWMDKKTVYKPIYDILQLLFTELFLLLLISIGLIIFLSGRLTRPLSEMVAVMRELGDGRIEARVPVTRQDEIGEVASTMNRMLSRIEELVKKITEDQNRQRMLELKAMQYQINPHFLYNTLDSVCMYARKNNGHEIAEMVTALSGYFRMSLNQGQEMITLGDEIRYALYYLEIQDRRFPGQVKWQIEIEEGLEEIRILKFILQPLVENSINHGIRNGQDKGMLRIAAYSQEHSLILEVSDNGNGMLPGELERVREMIGQDEYHSQDPFAGGFGMRNIHQRLKLYYGEASGLKIDSAWEEGTVITIVIPLNRSKDY